MSRHDQEYNTLLRTVRDFGEPRDDRTGVGTISMFGTRMHFDLSDGTIPLLTTKRVHTRSLIHELLWMMRGSTNNRELNDVGVTIWDEWADPKTGELGPIYGKQWRSWEVPGKTYTLDQLRGVAHALATNPHSRRHVVSAWNVAQLDDMALPPCHLLFQFYVSKRDHSLSCQLYQRSADMFLGVPFNIASYSILTCIFADTLGYKRGRFTWVGGDTHIYLNHLAQVEEQLSRQPRAAPFLEHIEDRWDPLRVRYEDIRVRGYDPHPAIKAEVAR